MANRIYKRIPMLELHIYYISKLKGLEVVRYEIKNFTKKHQINSYIRENRTYVYH